MSYLAVPLVEVSLLGYAQKAGEGIGCPVEFDMLSSALGAISWNAMTRLAFPQVPNLIAFALPVFLLLVKALQITALRLHGLYDRGHQADSVGAEESRHKDCSGCLEQSFPEQMMHLTQRERQILELALEGSASRESADRLKLRPSTEWEKRLRDRGISNSTIGTPYSLLRRIYNFYIENDCIDDIPFRFMEAPKAEKRNVNYAMDETLRRLDLTLRKR